MNEMWENRRDVKLKLKHNAIPTIFGEDVKHISFSSSSAYISFFIFKIHSLRSNLIFIGKSSVRVILKKQHNLCKLESTTKQDDLYSLPDTLKTF